MGDGRRLASDTGLCTVAYWLAQADPCDPLAVTTTLITPDGGDSDRRQVEGGFLLNTKLEAIELEQGLARQRDEHYKATQLRLDSRLVSLNLGVLVIALLALAVSIWQNVIARANADAAISAANTARQAQVDGAAGADRVLAEMKKQADAAKKQSEAALIQAEASRDMASQLRSANQLSADRNRDAVASMRREQRAIIENPVLRIDAEPEAKVPPGGERLVVRYNLSNIGKTPAIEVSVQDFAMLAPAPVPEPNWGAIKPMDALTLYPATSVLASERSVVTRNVPFTFGAKGIETYVDKSWRIYWWYRIRYRDAFDSYEMKYCVYHAYGDGLDKWFLCPRGTPRPQ
jgi:hypothetical protein